MAWILLGQELGVHAPALGAFLATLIIVAILLFVAYKLGKHSADVRWKHDVRYMPRVIGQDIRQEYEKIITMLQAKLDATTERLNAALGWPLRPNRRDEEKK